jgi:hypothetical protein
VPGKVFSSACISEGGGQDVPNSIMSNPKEQERRKGKEKKKKTVMIEGKFSFDV